MRPSFLHPTLIASTLATALAACGGGGEVVAPAPRIVTFAAEPTSVAPGQTTKLSYQVVGATSVKITTEAGDSVLPPTNNGTGSVVTNGLDATTTFVLTAENAVGPTTQSLTVTVEDPNGPRIDSFAATPATVQAGGSATLAWQSANGVGARIEVAGSQVYGVPAEQVASGQWVVTPAMTTTYTFVLVSADGSTRQQMATVTVEPVTGSPAIATFVAEPSTIEVGAQASLRWQASNATNVRITDAAGAVVYEGAQLAGTQAVTPQTTTTYTLTVSDDLGAAVTAMATLTVNQPGAARVVAFTASPITIAAGAASTLSWQVENAPAGVRIEAGGQIVHTDTAASGTVSVSPSVTTEYTLTALNPIGDASAMLTVTVSATPLDPAVLSFTSAATVGVLGGTVDLSWATQNASTVRLLSGATELFNSAMGAGSFTASLPAEVNTFTLEAIESGRPTAQASLTVYAHPVPSINSFTVTPGTISGPATVTVAWDVAGVSGLTLAQDGAAVPGFIGVSTTTTAVNSQGSLQVPVSTASTFELVATSAAGQATRTAQVQVLGATPEVEPNNTIQTAQVIPGAGAIAGNLSPADDYDVFRVTVGQGGNVFAQTSDGMGGCATDTLLYLTDINGTALAFDDDSAGGGCSRIDPQQMAEAGNLPAGDYLLVVLHATATGTGPYQLDVLVGTPACGNNIGETLVGEQCDFGDTTPGDGCSATCQLEINPTVVSAPGGTVQVNLPSADSLAVIRVDVLGGQTITATAADVGGATCNVVDTSVALYDTNLGFFGGKADGGPTGTAGDCGAIVDADAFGADLPAGSYYLVVFNDGTSTGPVEVTISVRDAVCGNGILEANAGEQCDNAGGPNAVPCSASCQVVTQGAVTLPAAGPQTLSGALVSGFDLYQVTVTQDLYVRAEAFSPSQAGGCNDDTVVVLYAQDFSFLAGHAGNPGCGRVDENRVGARVPPGQYWLYVSEATNAALPSYEVVFDSLLVGPGAPLLEVEPNDTQAQAQPTGLVAPGSVVYHASIDPSGEDDVYQVDVPANTSFTLDVRTFDTYGVPTSCGAFNDEYDTRIFVELAGVEVSAPNSGELDYNDDISATEYCSEITGRVLAGGAQGASYFVRVQGYDDTDVRQYFLQISLQ